MPSITGLTAAEVEARRAAGQTNQPPKSQTKTTGEIVRDNVCTYFNLVFLVLAVMLALVHSWLNMGFLGIVFWNTLIGIVQQLRAKRTIDKLTLVSAQKLRCLRDGRWCEVLSDDLVQDDVVEFGAGDQIAADAVVLDGSAQANESLITGEARAIPKECGAELKSGSFLMAGRCVARLTRVGAESYASRLTAEAQADGHRVARRDDAQTGQADKVHRCGADPNRRGADLEAALGTGSFHEGHCRRHGGSTHRYDPGGTVPADERCAGREHDAAGPPQGADPRHELH